MSELWSVFPITKKVLEASAGLQLDTDQIVGSIVLLHRIHNVATASGHGSLPAPQVDINGEGSVDILWIDQSSQRLLAFSVIPHREDEHMGLTYRRVWMRWTTRTDGSNKYDPSDLEIAERLRWMSCASDVEAIAIETIRSKLGEFAGRSSWASASDTLVLVESPDAKGDKWTLTLERAK